MSVTATEKNSDVWLEYCRAEHTADLARGRFLQATADPLIILRPALDTDRRVHALRTLMLLPEQERRQLLPELVALAARTIPEIIYVRREIASLDRVWLRGNIEALIWHELGQGVTSEQYELLAELLHGLGFDLLEELVRRALASPDPEIRKVGEFWQSQAVAS
jgi:hypothetical protein